MSEREVVRGVEGVRFQGWGMCSSAGPVGGAGSVLIVQGGEGVGGSPGLGVVEAMGGQESELEEARAQSGGGAEVAAVVFVGEEDTPVWGVVCQDGDTIMKMVARVRSGSWAITGCHAHEGAGEVRVVGVAAPRPLKDQRGGFEDEKVEDGEVDVELVVVVILHAPRQVQMAVCRGRRGRWMRVSHGQVF